MSQIFINDQTHVVVARATQSRLERENEALRAALGPARVRHLKLDEHDSTVSTEAPENLENKRQTRPIADSPAVDSANPSVAAQGGGTMAPQPMPAKRNPAPIVDAPNPNASTPVPVPGAGGVDDRVPPGTGSVTPQGHAVAPTTTKPE